MFPALNVFYGWEKSIRREKVRLGGGEWGGLRG